jgi:hypothetical protein
VILCIPRILAISRSFDLVASELSQKSVETELGLEKVNLTVKKQ